MATDINDFLYSKGYKDVHVDPYENNPISQRAAVVDALQKHKLKTNLKGEDQFLNAKQAEYLYDSMFNSEGKYKRSNANHKYAYTAFKNEVNKADGVASPLWNGHGSESAYGYGWAGNRVADYRTFGAMKMLVGDNARIMTEGITNSLGMMTRQQQLQWKTGGLLGKTMAVAQPLTGAYMLGSEILNNGDITEPIALGVSTAVGLAGFNTGKTAGGMLFNKQAAGAATRGGIKRLVAQGVLGAIGGATGMLGATALYYGARDMMGSDSAIAKAANSMYKAKALGNTQQTGLTLTMRQKGLQQLSQSAINDRAQVLGNEAAILKNLV